jgi:transcription initiation factor TFIID subunit TAF12
VFPCLLPQGETEDDEAEEFEEGLGSEEEQQEGDCEGVAVGALVQMASARPKRKAAAAATAGGRSSQGKEKQLQQEQQQSEQQQQQQQKKQKRQRVVPAFMLPEQEGYRASSREKKPPSRYTKD